MTNSLPMVRGKSAVTTSTGKFLAQIRNAKAAVPAARPSRPGADLVAAALSSGRPRLVLAIDATASREPCWSAARQVTDSLFSAIPGGLDVALAVHGGSNVHTFTEFSSDPNALRDKAATIECYCGETRLVPILERARDTRAKVIVYIGDVYEESHSDLVEAAGALRLRGTKVIVLHDTSGGVDPQSKRAFTELADRTQGAVLPFDPSSINKLKEILEAIAILAIGGIKLLESKAGQLPGARLLLANINKCGN